MAFTDQRVGRNQRVAAMTVVAVIQGAAIIALINGLAVKYFKPVDVPRTQSTDVATTVPLPPPPPKPPKPPVDARTTPEPRPQNPTGGPVTGDPVRPGPIDPQPMPTFTPEPQLPPVQPSPPTAPRSATPRNDPGSWVTTNDYPARDLREGNQGVTRFSLSIGTDGRVASCAIVASSGHPGLDKATCDLVSRRARFLPAVDSSGSRITSTYTATIRWVIPD
jgi:protein TonB